MLLSALLCFIYMYMLYMYMLCFALFYTKTCTQRMDTCIWWISMRICKGLQDFAPRGLLFLYVVDQEDMQGA